MRVLVSATCGAPRTRTQRPQRGYRAPLVSWRSCEISRHVERVRVRQTLPLAMREQSTRVVVVVARVCGRSLVEIAKRLSGYIWLLFGRDFGVNVQFEPEQPWTRIRIYILLF